MDNLKYVGKRLSSGLQTLSGKPVDHEAFRDFEVRTFKELFRNQIGDVIRKSSGIFRDGIYKDLPPQFDAFERLLSALEQKKHKRLEVTGATCNREEFLARVQVLIPISVPINEILSATSIAPDSDSYALVSFYTGLCKEFTELTKENELLDKALREFDSPGFLAAWNKKQTADGKLINPPVRESEFEDKAFDPDHVIPDIINQMRLERLYSYIVGDGKYLMRRFYRMPEGCIFRIEIDGYVSTPVIDGE